MNLNPFKKKVEERSGFTDALCFSFGGGFREGQSQRLSAVYRCVEVLSNSVAQLPFETYKLDNDGFKTKAATHPTYKLLNEEPNAMFTRFEFLKIMVKSMLLTGAAYAYIKRDPKGNVESINYVPTGDITVILPKQYWEAPLYAIRGVKDRIESCNMIAILNNTSDGYTGESTISYACRAIGLAQDADAHAGGFFKGGANLAGILKKQGRLTDQQKKDIKSSWQQAFGATSGTPNGIAVLEGDYEYQPITVNPVDAQLLETRKYSVAEICRFFGVSPVKVFDLSKASYNTVEASQLSFLTDTLQPILTKIEQEFNRKLFKPSEKSIYRIAFDTTSLLRTDKASLASYYNTMLTNGTMSINEVRRTLDLPPIEYGDEHLTQLNQASLKTIISQTKEDVNDATDNRVNIE